MDPALLRCPITDIADQIRTGGLSPVALVEALLTRIAEVDPRVHAYITVTADRALEAAHAAATEIRAGRYRGALHGIPIAHKDLLWTRGVRTTAHSRLLRDWVPDEDATAVERLAHAGAISLGKLSLHEFALAAPMEDVAFPPARNPWDLTRSPGGSSSGSAAAVASGLAYAATATDTGGSIRHPASVCGIVGMKPTFGRVSTHGVIAMAPSFDHVGPMTRTVRDNALMLQAMAGHDAQDPRSARQAVPDFSARIGGKLQGLRLGIPTRFIDGHLHHPDVLGRFSEACDVLRSLGAELREVDLPEMDCNADGRLLMGFEAWICHRESMRQHPEGYSRSMRASLQEFARITEAQRTTALATQRRASLALRAMLASEVDAIVSPGREMPADPAGAAADPSTPKGRAYRLYSLTGVPVLVVPAGFTRDGLPVGLQLAASLWREDVLYQLGAAYEDATGWWRQEPGLMPLDGGAGTGTPSLLAGLAGAPGGRR